MPNPDPILRNNFQTLEVYREMTTDAKIQSLLNLRKKTAIKFPYKIIPFDASPLAAEIADHAQRQIDRIDFIDLLRQMMTADEFGFSIQEVVWSDPRETDGINWIDRIVSRRQERFQFKYTGTPVAFTIGGITHFEPNAYPYKFIIHRTHSEAENPYGVSLLRGCYWPWIFKKAGWRFWMTASDKFGVPPIVVLFESDKDPSEIKKIADDLAQVLMGVKSDAGVALANVNQILTIEGKGTFDFRTLIECCDAQLSYAITDQVLASSEAEYGTRAHSEVHEKILRDSGAQAVKQIEFTLNNTLLKWIIERNYGKDAPMPKLSFETEGFASWDIVRDAIDRKVPLSKKWIYSNFAMIAPESNEDSFIMPDKPSAPQGGLLFADDFKKKQILWQKRPWLSIIPRKN
jgi:phage gp29-like protein